MRLSAEHQRHFDALLVVPVEPTTRVKKRLRAYVAELPQGEQRRVSQGVLDLVGCIERKTSPLYLRLIHAAAEFVQSCPDPQINLRVLNGVAHQCKRFERMLTP